MATAFRTFLPTSTTGRKRSPVQTGTQNSLVCFPASNLVPVDDFI